MNATERAQAAQSTSPIPKQSALLWLLAITLVVALLLRLVRLDLLPPGLYYDEAFNGVDARNVVEGLSRPLYFFANNGREPLFIYWQALWVAILGPTAYALRLAAALVGFATVVVIFWGARILLAELLPSFFTGSSQRQAIAGWLALIAAIGVAVSYWHLSLSRLGFRTNLLPLFSMVAVVLFWRGWQRGRARDFAWSGLWLGLSLYTYTAARLLPLVLAGFIAVELFLDLTRWLRARRTGARQAHIQLANGEASPASPRAVQFSQSWRGRLRNLALGVGVGLICSAPLLVEAVRHPSLLSARTEDVSIFTAAQVDMPGTPGERFVHNLGAIAAGFYTLGDENPRHNLPGRPFNDWLQAVLFTLGWLAALWWLRRPAARLLLIWFGVMAAPMLFSTQAPHALRATGLLPPLALLYGVGAGVIVGWLGRRWAPARVAGILAVVLLVVSGGLTVYDYFVRWAQLPEVGIAFDSDYQAAATAAAAALRAEPETPILLPRSLYETPQMRYAVGPLLPGELQANETLSGTVRYLGEAARADGAAPAETWRYLGLPLMDARWQTAAELTAEDVAALYAGQPYYLLQRPETGATATAVRVECGERSAEMRNAEMRNAECGVRSGEWGVGECATGSAACGVEEGGDDAAAPFGAWPGIVTTRWLSPTLAPFQPRYRLDQAFANGMHLVGYDVLPDRVDPADPQDPASFFLLTTYWQLPAGSVWAAGETPDQFAHLAFAGGQSQDNSPPGNTYLPDLWAPGQVVQTRRLLPAPPDAQPGKAIFETGLYFQRPDGSSERVNLIDGNGQVAGDSLRFGPVSVGQAAPAADWSGLTPTEVIFDGTVALAGWRAAGLPGEPGQVTVDLGWQSVDRVAPDYTLFVHAVDSDGQIVAQSDQPPGGAANPTSHWVPGETVRTRVALTLPPGTQASDLRLRVGLYEPVSGRQLPITTCELTDGVCEQTFALLPLP